MSIDNFPFFDVVYHDYAFRNEKKKKTKIKQN